MLVLDFSKEWAVANGELTQWQAEGGGVRGDETDPSDIEDHSTLEESVIEGDSGEILEFDYFDQEDLAADFDCC